MQTTGLECGHQFCVHCWCEYLTTKIMSDGIGQTIACPAYSCDILVDDASVMRLVRDPSTITKYQHLITNSFVECNRLLRWCPSPGCSNAVKVQPGEGFKVTCKCSHAFCFACGENWHDPIKCHMLKTWLKKCSDDSETTNWIATNTKQCPACKTSIEKDGGCNHIRCRNDNCDGDFCWVCLGPWKEHEDFYNCNVYEEVENEAESDAMHKSRHELERYLFYSDRYMNHMASLKFEKKLYALIRKTISDLDLCYLEGHYLFEAVEILCQCRQTLMYTYAFAFYLKRNNQYMIFEDNQKDLEKATETLSKYLEQDFTAEIIANIQPIVSDQYRYCNSRMKLLIQHVHEGYEHDLWDYNEQTTVYV